MAEQCATQQGFDQSGKVEAKLAQEDTWTMHMDRMFSRAEGESVSPVSLLQLLKASLARLMYCSEVLGEMLISRC